MQAPGNPLRENSSDMLGCVQPLSSRGRNKPEITGQFTSKANIVGRITARECIQISPEIAVS